MSGTIPGHDVLRLLDSFPRTGGHQVRLNRLGSTMVKHRASRQPTLRFVDLFCGIGGFHLGMTTGGIHAECVLASDSNEQAKRTYLANHSVPRFEGDITKVDSDKIPDHDILCAGFPCQPFSIAGLKRGFDDHRGNLFFEIMRIVDGKRPRVLFLENVKGLVQHDDGRTFQVIRQEIESRGYSFEARIIEACEYNLPQYRPRIYIVAFDRQRVEGWRGFRFPPPIPLTTTMSDVWEAPCDRPIGRTLLASSQHHAIGAPMCWDGYIVDGEERWLSPKEGKRMMGFPEDFKFPVSKTAALHQLGNAVAVPVIRAIGQEIAAVLTQGEVS